MFSKSYSDAACNFFELVLKHSADEWYGKPFILAPWQEQALTEIFGNVDEDGNRNIEMAYLEVPKKAGKSELIAGVILFILVTANMPGCQVYGAAAATRQALNVYRAAAKMVEQSPILRKRLRILRSTNRILKYSDPDSFYAAIAADGDLGDGVNPSFVVADEVHRWRTRKQLENWDVLSNGGITRKQTLTIAITTAGVQNESPLAWRLHEKTEKIAKGIVSDPKFYGRIYAADKDDDPLSDEAIVKANPSLIQNGGFLPIEKIQQKRTSAIAEGDLSSYKRYFLNLWDQKEDLAIPIKEWDESAGNWKAAGLLKEPAQITVITQGKTEEKRVRGLPTELLARFIERRCWAGVDISMTTDFSAVGLVFDCPDEERYEVLPFIWLPDDNIKMREAKLSVPLRRWAEEGLLELCPGKVIDTRMIRARLDWARQMFELREVCLDPWNSRQLSVQMIEDGFTCVEVRQGYATLSEPTKKIKELVSRGTLNHGNHQPLRWMAGCAATMTDGRDNIMFSKPDRNKSASRIDAIAAIANAMTRAIIATNKPNASYEVTIL